MIGAVSGVCFPALAARSISVLRSNLISSEFLLSHSPLSVKGSRNKSRECAYDNGPDKNWRNPVSKPLSGSHGFDLQPNSGAPPFTTR